MFSGMFHLSWKKFTINTQHFITAAVFADKSTSSMQTIDDSASHEINPKDIFWCRTFFTTDFTQAKTSNLQQSVGPAKHIFPLTTGGCQGVADWSLCLCHCGLNLHPIGSDSVSLMGPPPKFEIHLLTLHKDFLLIVWYWSVVYLSYYPYYF